jgi:transposase
MPKTSFRKNFLFPHETRGLKANHAMSVLPFFDGMLCHDHWKAYFQFGSGHVLCNAHHSWPWIVL